jgi:hypothetical protein
MSVARSDADASGDDVAFGGVPARSSSALRARRPPVLVEFRFLAVLAITVLPCLSP